jgi:hypothetical protein
MFDLTMSSYSSETVQKIDAFTDLSNAIAKVIMILNPKPSFEELPPK